MKGDRRAYTVALVAAVIVLIGSMGLAAACAANGQGWPWSPSDQAGRDAWPRSPGQGMTGRSWDGDGMMGRGRDGDEAEVDLAQATRLAKAWLAENQPGSSVGEGIPVRMGFVFRVTEAGRTVGTLMVDNGTGRIFFRQWGNPNPTATSGT